MEISDPKNTSIIGHDLDDSSLQGGAVRSSSSEKDTTTTSSVRFDVSQRGGAFLKQFQLV